MSNRNFSRRRALQIAGVAAVPGAVLNFGQSLSAAASIDTNLSDNQEGKAQPTEVPKAKNDGMELGAFSISLTVKDLKASREFYEKFGFKAFAGDPKQNWQILKNGDHVIGLFQGMFEKNIMTFNPGWDQNAQKLKAFTDVRELQRQLKAKGVKLTTEADEKTTGPASLTAVDPDGNLILIDQHV